MNESILELWLKRRAGRANEKESLEHLLGRVRNAMRISSLKDHLALPPPTEDEPREDGWESHFDERQKMFSETHTHLLGLRQSSFEKSDELIITISSAFLALSVGFIKDIVPLERSTWIPLLVASWLCFFGAILTNFASHFWARNAIEDQIDCARYYFLEGRTKYLDPHINQWTRLTERFNTTAATFFGAGVFLTLLFVSHNVLREQAYQYNKAMSQPKLTPNRPQKGPLHEAPTPPRIQPLPRPVPKEQQKP